MYLGCPSVLRQKSKQLEQLLLPLDTNILFMSILEIGFDLVFIVGSKCLHSVGILLKLH